MVAWQRAARPRRKVIAELEKQFGSAKCKPRFVVMFDNDRPGKTAGLELTNALKAAGYPCVQRFFESETAGSMYQREGDVYTIPKVDANDVLQQQGNDGLVDRMVKVIEDSEGELERQAASMAAAAERERVAELDKSGMATFLFRGYFTTDFERDMELGAKYSERKTGFENLDAAQIFTPGLYVVGALPATGKSTWTWQLLDQLAERGETCIYCSFEMSKAELFTKSLARELYRRYPELSERLNLSSANIRRGACRDLAELKEIAAQFANSPADLRVAELSNVSAAELIERLKPLVANVDKSPVIAIDYLQILPNKDVRTASAKEKIDDAMLRLKNFQRESGASLIVISSFNRDGYQQSASFSSFKESGNIEYTADVVWGLEVHGVDTEGEPNPSERKRLSKEKVRPVKLSCLKNRNGGLYETFFTYYAAHDFFEPFEEKAERSPHIR